jgi:hypothetical protein
VRRALAIAVVLTFYAALAAVAVDKSVDQGGDATALSGMASPGVTRAGASSGEATSNGTPDTVSGNGANDDDRIATATSPAATRTATGGDGAPRATGSGAADPTSAATPPTNVASTGGGTILIGVHDDDPGAAFGQYGVKGGPSGDQHVWVERIVAWINANGGMGGRKVQTVYHVTQSLNGTFDQQAEQACVAFTEDTKVVAVVSGARVPTLNLVDCLARHRTPLVWSYQYMADQATFDRYADYLYMPNMVSADRLGVWIDALADENFFKGGTIGIVRYDNAIHRKLADAVIKPRLAAHGAAVKEEVAFREATGAASAADLSAQANNAILRFQASGVNRVIFEPTSAVLPLLFFAAAEAQHFRPKYTMTTYDIPSFQSDNAPAAQLDGAKAFGWTPAGDVAWAQEPPPNPTARRCVDITNGADPPGNGSVRRFCDGLLFLKYVFDHGADPTPAGIRRVVDGLGRAYESAWTFATVMGPGRHDGAAVGRIETFGGACGCWTYTGPERAIR